jgi:repressor LexA
MLAAIARFIEEHGYSPTIRELGKVLGIHSSQSCHSHVKALERKGYVYHIPGSARTLRLKTAAAGWESVRVIGGRVSKGWGFGQVRLEGMEDGDGGDMVHRNLLQRLGMVDEENGAVRPGRLWFEAEKELTAEPQRGTT